MAETLRPGAGLSHGLLLWVLAGHAAAVWLARASLEATPDTTRPRVLRVSWVAAERPAEPAPAPRPAPPARKPAETVRPPAPVAAQVAPPAPPEPDRPAPADVPLAAPAVPAVPPTAPVAPVALAAGEPIAPAPPELPVPPSYHADYLANPVPAYPAISRRMREEGVVRLRVLVGPDGLPREVRLDAGSGHPRLDEAARAAVAGWRFVPARLGDRTVSGWVLVPISFSLRSRP